MPDEYSRELHQHELIFTGEPGAIFTVLLAYTQLLSTSQYVSFVSCDVEISCSFDE